MWNNPEQDFSASKNNKTMALLNVIYFLNVCIGIKYYIIHNIIFYFEVLIIKYDVLKISSDFVLLKWIQYNY